MTIDYWEPNYTNLDYERPAQAVGADPLPEGVPTTTGANESRDVLGGAYRITRSGPMAYDVAQRGADGTYTTIYPWADWGENSRYISQGLLDPRLEAAVNGTSTDTISQFLKDIYSRDPMEAAAVLGRLDDRGTNRTGIGDPVAFAPENYWNPTFGMVAPNEANIPYFDDTTQAAKNLGLFTDANQQSGKDWTHYMSAAEQSKRDDPYVGFLGEDTWNILGGIGVVLGVGGLTNFLTSGNVLGSGLTNPMMEGIDSVSQLGYNPGGYTWTPPVDTLGMDPAVPAPDTLGADILDWSAKNPLTPSDLTNLGQTLTPEQWQQYAASVEQGLVNPALNPTTDNGILDTIRSTLTSVTGLDPKTQKTLAQSLLSGYMTASTNKNIQKQNDQSRALGTAAMPASYSTNLSPVTAGGALGTITGQPRDWRSTVAGKIPGYARGGAIGPLGKLKMAGKRSKSQRGGQADDIPAMLSEGEYVVDADTVAALGDGSNDAGASRLDQMRENVRTHKRSKPVSSIPPKAKAPEQYL